MAKALRSFEALLRRVVRIPKEKVDARIAEKHATTKVQREKSTDIPQQK